MPELVELWDREILKDKVAEELREVVRESDGVAASERDMVTFADFVMVSDNVCDSVRHVRPPYPWWQLQMQLGK